MIWFSGLSLTEGQCWIVIMVTLFTAFLCPCLILALGDQENFTVAVSAQSQTDIGASFSSLSQALIAVSNLPNVQLQLLAAENAYTITVPVHVTGHLEVAGSAQVVEVADLVSVTVGAVLRIIGAVLRVKNTSIMHSVFDIAGLCVFENVSVEHIEMPLVFLSGDFSLIGSLISGNSAIVVVITSANTSIQLTSSTLTNLTAPFLTTPTKGSQAVVFNLTSVDCTFRGNQLTAGRSLFEIQGMMGEMAFIGCEYWKNQRGLFFFDSENLQASWINTTFSENRDSLVSGFLSNSTAVFLGCLFRDNFGISINFFQFDGRLDLIQSNLTRQNGKGPISLINSKPSASCLLTIHSSVFSDFNVSVLEPSPGAFALIFCYAVMIDAQVSDVLVYSPVFSNIRSLFFAQNGGIWLANCTMKNSGSSGFFLAVFIGQLHMEHFQLVNPFSGAGLYILCANGPAIVENGYVAQGSSFQPPGYSVYVERPAFVVFLQSIASVANLYFEHSIELMGPFVGFQFSTCTMTNISAKDFFTHNFFAMLQSTAVATNVHGENIDFDMNPIAITMSLVVLRNVTFVNCRCVVASLALFWVMHNTDITVQGLVVRNTSAGAFMKTPFSVVTLNDVVIEKCKFDLLIHFTCNAQISFQRFSLLYADTALIFDTNSTLIFTDTIITSLTSHRLLMGGYGTRLSLVNVTVRNLSSSQALGKFMQDSKVTFQNCTFDSIAVTDQIGWQLSEGELNIFDSHFRHYELALFQGILSNITISRSSFSDGLNPTVSLLSKAAYGGVLGCVSCPQVHISQSEVTNVTSKVGGGFSFRSNSPLEATKVAILSSYFARCAAARGGAIFIENAAFNLTDCRFIQNEAKLTGGALEAIIKPAHSNIIMNSVFLRNRAEEGGAVKWSNAQVYFANASFSDNSAVYGPNIASYGVTLSSALTMLTGEEVSGIPLTLVFELLDHYNQRVVLSPFKSLKLTTTQDIKFSGNEVAMLSQGFLNFTGITVYAQPGLSHIIEAKLPDTQGDYSFTIENSIKLPFRNCTSGEIYRKDRCEYCFPGNVSFSPDDQACRFCPVNAFCSGGNSQSVNKGYWASAWNSSELHRCPFPSKCLGGINSTCAHGFTGQFCNQCGADTFRIRITECVTCLPTVGTICQLCIPLLLYFGYIHAILSNFKNSLKLFVVKTLITHLQVLYLVSFLRMSYPLAITYFLHGVSYLSSLLVTDLPLSCLGVENSQYWKAIIGSLLLPCLVGVNCVVCFICFRSWKLKALLLSTSTLLFTPLVTIQTLFPLLACKPVNSSSLLFLDMGQICWQGLHLKMVLTLLLPSFLLNVFIPLVAAIVLSLLRPAAYSQCFPLWICGHRYGCTEALLCVWRGFLLAVVIAAIGENNLVQITYAFSVLIFICVITVTVSKYVYTEDFNFAIAETSLVVTSLSVGFLSYFSTTSTVTTIAAYIFSSATLAANVAYLGWGIYSLLFRKETPVIEKQYSEVAPPHNSLEVHQNSSVSSVK